MSFENAFNTVFAGVDIITKMCNIHHKRYMPFLFAFFFFNINSLLCKRLKEAGVLFMEHFLKIVTLLCNTIYLPFEMMIDATNHIRADALSGGLDEKAVNSVCNYWIKCINAKKRFHRR